MKGGISLPANILSKLRFRINHKKTANFTVRVDGADTYLVAYTDGDYNASQATASLQPEITDNGFLFSSHLLQTNNLGDIAFAAVVANHDGAFSPYKPFISGYQGGVPYPSIMGQSGSDLFDGNGGTYTQSDIRVNNVATLNFSPNANFKVITAKFGAKSSNVYDIGSNIANGFMQGTIKDILLFHTEPTEGEKVVLQSYLQVYHNL